MVVYLEVGGHYGGGWPDPDGATRLGGGRKELDLEVAESWRPLTLGSSRRIGSRGEPALEVGGGPVVNEWIRKK
jgi:hypothetical protein